MEQILRGTIDAYGFSVIEAQIANSNNEGVLIKGVVDTAAYKFYLKQSVIDFLKLPVIGRTNDAHATEGEGDVILYSCGLEIQNFDFGLISVAPIRLAGFPYEFIIGTSFLKQYTFKYFGKEGYFTIT